MGGFLVGFTRLVYITKHFSFASMLYSLASNNEQQEYLSEPLASRRTTKEFQ
jgi:hypothetical protein